MQSGSQLAFQFSNTHHNLRPGVQWILDENGIALLHQHLDGLTDAVLRAVRHDHVAVVPIGRLVDAARKLPQLLQQWRVALCGQILQCRMQFAALQRERRSVLQHDIDGLEWERDLVGHPLGEGDVLLRGAVLLFR